MIGSVVVIRFPFVNDEGFKKRPVLVYGTGFPDETFIGLQITSNTKPKIDSRGFDCAVPLHSPSDFQVHQLALNQESVIRVDMVFTLVKSQIVKYLSPVTDAKFLEVQERFKLWYEMP